MTDATSGHQINLVEKSDSLLRETAYEKDTYKIFKTITQDSLRRDAQRRNLRTVQAMWEGELQVLARAASRPLLLPIHVGFRAGREKLCTSFSGR